MDQKKTGRFIAKMRKQQNLTQRELADSLGVSDKTVSKWECGIPTNYFDVIYSVYGIGWTTQLNKTFQHVYSYLKKGGIFVFGWSHPIHKCVSVENGRLIFSNSYFNEEWYRADMGSKKIMLSNHMLSTYINALAGSGFVIETLTEATDRERAMAAEHDFGRKALMLPTVFVLRARK